QQQLSDDVDAAIAEIKSLLHGISLVRHCSPRVLDSLLAYGELLSSRVVASSLRAAGVKASAVDARELFVTDDTYGQAVVDREESYARVVERVRGFDGVAVVTGFISATRDGITTTLGRGGSDYTATLIGAALNADLVEIWSDVDGILSADPRIVPQAFSLDRVTYTELMELSHFGTKVVHAPSVAPAAEANVPLLIRNTFNPAFPGTAVVVTDPGAKPDDRNPRTAVRGISSINNIALCRLEGARMLGVPGIASRLFGALARDGISVILISQASSEHSICFALTPDSTERARTRVDAEFDLERKAGAVSPLVVEQDFSVVAAVGEAMRETPGIAGRLFDVLGRNGVNVRAIAQGSSELNISIVIPRTDETRALRLIHDAFFQPRVRNVQLFIAGTGRVGAALLDQLESESVRVVERLGLRLTVSGIGRSNTALISDDGLALQNWRPRVESAEGGSVITAALRSTNAHRVFVDCTASPEVASSYEELLRHGLAIVSANKIALSGSLESYHRLRNAAQFGNGLYSETTVGAGLPVLRPIADLIATGDVVAKVEGVLSGTLSFLFGRVMAGASFSEAVKEAHRLGFTEPDPREDLSGRDVARKLLVLGREAGFQIEPDALRVEAVLSETNWAEMTLPEFWEALPSADERFERLRSEAQANNGVLCYLGSIGDAGAQVSLQTLDQRHACAALTPGDNLIAVTSARYSERPLIIRGPGAGPDVTAAGVFADILRAAAELR
ncbi:MAG TPA: bifunctional aspartate kinase/homoserine dehydrogenase I, partial [Longimicrobiales bacterium]|nr:bifunctional aspartate kinase/homoserine dehydrogenase I [Longimicrobiales bacterium]